MRYVYLSPGEEATIKSSGRMKSQKYLFSCDRDGSLITQLLNTKFKGVSKNE